MIVMAVLASTGMAEVEVAFLADFLEEDLFFATYTEEEARRRENVGRRIRVSTMQTATSFVVLRERCTRNTGGTGPRTNHIVNCVIDGLKTKIKQLLTTIFQERGNFMVISD